MGRREDIVQAAKLSAERAKSGGTAAGGVIRRGGDAAGGAVRRGGEAVGATVQSGREIGDAALSTGKKAASTAVGKGAALTADLAAAAARLVPQRLESLGSPTLPLTSRWGVGFGEFLSGMDGVPKGLGSILKRLDKIGAVAVSPENLEFDGEVLEWRNIKAITLGSPVDAMSAKAAEEMVKRVREALPRFPGRTFVVRQAVELLIALGLVAVRPDVARGDAEPALVVTSVRYAGRLRQKELTPSYFAIMVCAAKPAVATAIAETSRPFGTVVTIQKPNRAVARTLAVRDLAVRLRKQIASESDDDIAGARAVAIEV